MEDGLHSVSPTQVLLQRWRGGDRAAGDALAGQVYGNLRRLAASYMHRERQDHTPSPTALVHEAYPRLAAGSLSIEDRAHLLAMAAREMPRVLADHARSRNCGRRSG